METKKTFWAIALETIKGVNDEGSSKRATAFGFYILSFVIILTYAPAYFYCAVLYKPPLVQISQYAYQLQPAGVIQQAVVDQLIPVFVIVVGTLTGALSITAYEKKVEAKKIVDLNCPPEEKQ